jgi:hypothetical protein
MLGEVLKLTTEAAAGGEYETAYHLLMAALHIADHAKDVGALEHITQLAKEHGAAVERVQPPHPLSRAHARMRGQTALYESLLAHIDAVRLRLHSDEQRAKLRR